MKERNRWRISGKKLSCIEIIGQSIISKDYKNKVKKLKRELETIKEQTDPIVVEAIIKREMIKPITYFHIEMIVLTIIALFPAYLK